MEPRKKLTDILLNSEREQLERAWSTTKAADDLKPIPAGDYRFRVVSGDLFTAKTGTPGFKLALEVLEGEHTARRVWHDLWLSEAALAMTKRDLLKLGIERPEQLERPLPDGIIIAARVALRRGDDGAEFNRVIRFEVIGIEPPESEPFAPLPDGSPDDDRTDRLGLVAGLAEEVLPDGSPDDDRADSDGFSWASGTQRKGKRTK